MYHAILMAFVLFVFSLVSAAWAAPFAIVEKDDQSVLVSEGEKPVLCYHFGETTCKELKEGDSRRSRACYVHPLWGLGGEVLTDDYPVDHRHHHGIFWTWPHIVIDGKHYCSWIDDGKIETRFLRWIERTATDSEAKLVVENGWFIGEKQVMREEVRIQVHPATGDSRAIDFTLTFAPTDRPITLLGAGGKSYGGMTIRFHVIPDTKSELRTAEGLAKEDLSDTRFEWVDLMWKPTETSSRGKIQGGGAALFVSPDHPDYPPTWLARHYGALCIGYPGVKGKTFEPGVPFTLRYRVLVHSKTFDAKSIQDHYETYKKEIALN